ncbi:MAG: sialidase family protein [Parcubacteria group bacterium]
MPTQQQKQKDIAKKPWAKSKKCLAVWSFVFALPVFIAVVYLMHVAVLAYLFATRPLHGAGPFPYIIYAIPWVVAAIIAFLFALLGWRIGRKMCQSQDSPQETKLWVITLAISIAAATVGGGFCWWQRNVNQDLQNETSGLYNRLANQKEGLVLPNYVTPEQIAWIERVEKSTIYAVSRPVSTYLRPISGYTNDSILSFVGVLKSSDNGQTWQQIYQTDNDILDFSLVSEKYLYSMTVSRYGGGSGEMFIKIASSSDGGDNWSTSEEIAKNDDAEENLQQPLIYGATGGLIVDQSQPDKSYFLYKENADDAFNKMITTSDRWQTWERKDVAGF